MNRQALYGVVAEFSSAEDLLRAARKAYGNGYRELDAFTPYPVDELAAALGHRFSSIPLIVLLGGIFGCLGGYFMQWYAMAYDYPINIGGKPFNSWPMFIPVTFELTILCASLAGFFGMLLLNKYPQPYHPIFNAPGFEKASRDKFLLCISARDPKFERGMAEQFLAGLKPDQIISVHE
jgi:hypothetical protein